jgi:DNA-binding transcriptional LysR family regulator
VRLRLCDAPLPGTRTIRSGVPELSVESTRRGARAKDSAVVRVHSPFAANNSEALRDAAAAGLGIALLPDFSAQSGLQSGRLLKVLPDWEPIESFGDCLYAVRPYAALAPRPVTAFVAFLKKQYAGGFSA